MRKWFLLTACLAAFLVPTPVRAQAGVHFSAVQVDIWPEYDRPAVLVVDRLTLAGGTSLPMTLTLKIPSRAELGEVTVVDSAGTRVDAPYDRQLQGDWAILNIMTNSLQVQVEYYDTLSKTGNARHVLYEWGGDGAVDAFTVDFLLPSGATNPILDPPIAAGTMRGGLVEYKSGASSLSAGRVFTLTVDYQKSTDTLSVSGMPVQAAQPVTESTLGRLMESGILTTFIETLVGLLAVALLVWLVIWLMKRRRSGLRFAGTAAGEPAKGAEQEVYCSQCGKRAQSGDVFCRSCGTRLRKTA